MDRYDLTGSSYVNRRTAIVRLSAITTAAAWMKPAVVAAEIPGSQLDARPSSGNRLRKIATEEAFSIPEVAAEVRQVVRRGGSSLDLKLLDLIYDPAPETVPSAQAQAANRDAAARTLLPRLLDVDAGRLADMNANGVDMHLLSLGMPGVQLFDTTTAITLARLSNDRLSETVRGHPGRFAGLACFAPQDPRAAANEMERGINTLKLSGFLVNSHTGNGYLDEQRYWPILEAAEALDAPLYIHPRAPSDGMAAPFRDYRMEGAIWGYGVEAGTHAVRLMLSGVLDRFPRLRIVLGHMGEALRTGCGGWISWPRREAERG